MNEDFVTQLRLQLREAALREERRTPVAQRFVRARRGLPGPRPVAATLATVLLALAVAAGALALRGQPEPAEPKVIATLRVADGLSSLAPGFGSVWAADPIRGEILRIDPGTRRVAARIPVRGDARVATGAGAVWAIAGDLQYSGDKGPVRLLRIDPTTNRVVARIPLRTPAGASFGPVDLQIGGDAVWVVGVGGALRIDPRQNEADRFVPLADEGGDVTRGVVADGDSVWMLTLDGRLRRLDANTGQAVDEVPVRAPADAYLFGGHASTLTLVGTNQIAVLERPTGRLLWRAALEADIRYWITDGDVLWVHVARDSAEPDQLVRLDAGSGGRRGQLDLPEPGAAGIAKVGHEVWIGTPSGTVIVVR
jgi:hypothetical protein